MRRAFILLAYLFAAASLFAEVNTASLDDMAASHVARLARRDGVIPCSRHETLTNDFGRIRGECVRELGLGVHYLQIRDVDGWLEVRTEDGMLEREVAPIGDRPTTWLWDLFGLSESERAEDYWRLSYLVSRWEIVDDSYVETDASRSSVPFRASARSSTVSSGAPNGRCLIRVSVTNAPSQAVLVRVGSLAVVVDGRCELVFPAEVYANYAYECRNADIPVALSCEDGLAPFRGTESLSVTEPTEGHVGTVGVIPVLAASGQNALNGVSPVAFLGGGFYVAPTNDDLTVSVSLVARNIGDGQRESGVAAVFYPLVINQLNHPRAMGVEGTTDDTRSLATNDVSGALAFDITAAFTNEVIGGRLDLTARVSNTVERTLPVFIRGKNPKDEVAKAYIDANVDADFRDFAWMIAKHESKQGSRAYNQFNPAGPKIELPNKTSGDARWGWGMCQIDRGRTGVVARTVYNWQDNVSQMNATLSEKLRTYNRFIGYYRSAYRLSPNWSEPDSVSTNIHGVSVSAKDWALLTLYNGSSGVVERVVSGRNFRSPVHFNESNGSWTFVTNVNDYVRKVCEDAARTSQD